MTSAVAVILAAGKGTRMGSDRPKVLHELGGDPLVLYPLRAANAVGVGTAIVVVGHGRGDVMAAVKERVARSDATPAFDLDVRFAVQDQQRGTGHAVSCALPELPSESGAVLILSGDVPLVRPQTLQALLDAQAESGGELAFATFRPPSPDGYGRIVRNHDGDALAIREHVDASADERGIAECNAGIYCVSARVLREQLPKLGSDNRKGEVYLTDLVELQAARGGVATVEVDAIEVAGVNTPQQLEQLESWLRRERP